MQTTIVDHRQACLTSKDHDTASATSGGYIHVVRKRTKIPRCVDGDFPPVRRFYFPPGAQSETDNHRFDPPGSGQENERLMRDLKAEKVVGTMIAAGVLSIQNGGNAS